MRTLISRRFWFSAAHTIAADAWCGERTHGHDFYLVVECVNRPDSWSAVTDLLFELNDRDLNKMVVGTEPSFDGIAAWVLERLRLYLPSLRRVTVGARDIEATVEV